MNLMNSLKIGLLFTIVVFIISCSSKHNGYKKHESGMYFKFHTSTDGKEAVSGDIITLDIRYGTKDSILFDSKLTNVPFQREFIEPEFKGDIYECIQMMKLGDSASFIIKADSFYLKTARMQAVPVFMNNDNDLYVDLNITDISTREEIKEKKRIELVALKEKEQTLINKYLSAKKTKLNKDGIYFKTLKKGSGLKPTDGQMVLAHYDISILEGQLIYSSKSTNTTIDFEFNSQFETEGFKIALRNMSKGEIAEFMIPSNLALGENGTAKVPPYSAVFYTLEIIDIMTKEDYKNIKENEKGSLKSEEIKKIEKYLSDNNISSKPTTESGLYYMESKKGNGPQVKSGDKIKVHYSLYLLDGKLVDSSVERGTPLDIEVDKTSVIQGWHEGLKLMNIGSKAKILIPSSQGYGDRKRSEDILPYTPLLFELEVLEITE